jgi:hypothetical protein
MLAFESGLFVEPEASYSLWPIAVPADCVGHLNPRFRRSFPDVILGLNGESQSKPKHFHQKIPRRGFSRGGWVSQVRLPEGSSPSPGATCSGAPGG